MREVETECAAVRSAIDGDLTGRAQQAVTRIRPECDDGQYAAAQALLHEIPMGSERLSPRSARFPAAWSRSNGSAPPRSSSPVAGAGTSRWRICWTKHGS